ncbi:hypothetical protein [Rickettsia endosymbiont of Halotydeus destructor]|uniref:hypothetical protein n=1 Tax=Rickettsia endosymbiont of Halotydeus destructor TaxID=2996754 RepID=UPI003BB22112
MNTNNILKIMIGASSIAQKVTNNIVDKSHNLIEDKILKGNYVTREEFEKLQILVIKLQKQLTELKK